MKKVTFQPEELRYLRLLAQQYPTVQAASREIINLQAILNLPKGTEHFVSDIAGGSTLGNISLHHVSVPTIDIGVAQLAMHSSYETGSVADAVHLKNALTAFYGATLDTQGDACAIL